MSNTESFIEKFQNLSISQKKLVTSLIEEIATNNQQDTVDTNAHKEPNPRFISSNGIELAKGDRVRVLTSRKSGNQGDIATVQKFNKLYVAIKLIKNRTITQRASKHLEHIE